MISFDIGQAGALTAHVREQIRGAKERGVLSAAARLVQIIKTELIPHETPPPVDQSSYIDGWNFGPTPTGAEVFNTVPHAPVIEWGARGENVKIGRKLIDALAEWAVRKGYATAEKAESFAWGLATNMKKRGIFNRNGTEGLRILEKAQLRAPALIAEEIRAELEEAMRG